MAYVKPKYEGEDFLEWYKTHYGKDYDGSALNRGEGMLDQDWEIGSALYGTYKDKLAREEQYNNDKALLEKGYNDAQSVADNTYNTQKESLVGDYNKNQAELLKNYQSSVSGLDKSKNQSLQSASINYDKLKKYLPTQIKAQGLGGLGVSESTMLQAHNNYATQTGAIKNNYNENKTALEEAYGSNKANLDTTHESNMSSLENQKLASDTERKTTLDQSLADLLTYYNSDMQGYKPNIGEITQRYKDIDLTEKANNFSHFDSLLEYHTGEDFNALVEQIMNLDVSEDDRNKLLTKAQTIVNNNIKVRTDREAQEQAQRDEQSRLEAVQTIKYGIEQMLADPKNFFDESTLTEAGYNRIKNYLDNNKSSLGEADYNAMLGTLNGYNMRSNQVRDTEFANTISGFMNNSNHNSRLEQMSNALDSLEASKGQMSDEEYQSFISQIYQGTRADFNTYYVQGLGSGRNNDDIDITIGSTSRNRKTEFDLLCGDEVTNATAKGLLNKLTTGSADVTPSNGRLVVVANKMYIYTKKGWRIVKNDNSDIIGDAINAFLNS